MSQLQIGGKCYEVLKLVEEDGNAQRYLAKCCSCEGSHVILIRYALSSDEAMQRFDDLVYLWHVLQHRTTHLVVDIATEMQFCQARDCMLGYRVVPVYQPALQPRACPSSSAVAYDDAAEMAAVRCFAIIRGIAAAVMSLHALSPPLTHGRLSPDCVVCDSAGRTRVSGVEHATCFYYTPRNDAEVGLTREELIDRHQPRSFCAPELRRVHVGRRVDKQMDMWSLGILILHVFSQLLLQRADTTSGAAHDDGIAHSHASSHTAGSEAEATMRRRVDATVRLVRTRLLVVDPAERATAFDFVRQLNDILAPMRGLRLPHVECAQQQQQRPRFTS